MSNRLRASMRAGNKGRSLRPRTSPSRNSSLPPESDLAAGEGQEQASGASGASEASEAPESAEPETLQVSRGARPAEPAAEVIAPAKITPAEVLAAGEAFSNLEDDEDDVPVAKVEAPVSVEKVEPVVVAKKVEPVVVAKKVEPVVVVAKKVEPVVVAKKAEPVAAVNPGKKNEPVVAAKKSEPLPVSSQNRKSEPVKAADTKKADDTAQSQRTPLADVDLRSGNKKKGGKNEGAKVDAKRPTNDEVDDSSISAEFFRREGDSLPPMVDAHGEHEDHDDHGGVHVLSAATMARRARLRRVVAGVVAFAGVITLAVVGKTLAASKQPATSTPMRPPVTQEARVEPKPEEKAPPVAAPTPTAVAVVAPTASAEVARVEPDPKADAKAADDAKKAADDAKKAEEPKKVEASGGDVKALTKEAESFLNRGNRKDAMVKAHEAIAADPSEAMAYLLLGSALQDSGKWKDGIEAYSECVRNATKGPVGDCRQMGGHK